MNWKRLNLTVVVWNRLKPFLSARFNNTHSHRDRKMNCWFHVPRPDLLPLWLLQDRKFILVFSLDYSSVLKPLFFISMAHHQAEIWMLVFFRQIKWNFIISHFSHTVVCPRHSGWKTLDYKILDFISLQIKNSRNKPCKTSTDLEKVTPLYTHTITLS